MSGRGTHSADANPSNPSSWKNPKGYEDFINWSSHQPICTNCGLHGHLIEVCPYLAYDREREARANREDG
jgi:hypothetical protein